MRRRLGPSPHYAEQPRAHLPGLTMQRWPMANVPTATGASAAQFHGRMGQVRPSYNFFDLGYNETPGQVIQNAQIAEDRFGRSPYMGNQEPIDPATLAPPPMYGSNDGASMNRMMWAANNGGREPDLLADWRRQQMQRAAMQAQLRGRYAGAQ